MTTLNATGRVQLGRTELSVTPICFGTSALGNMPEVYQYTVDEERARATVRSMLAGPANFIDTSRNYGAGRSEARIGEVIRELGGLPADVVISTKLDRDAKTNYFDAARARRSLEESLQALGLDRVHLLHLHDPEHSTSLDEITKSGGAVDELFKMKEEGLADAVGLAAGKVDVMMPILRDWDFDALITHNRFTLLNRNAEIMIDFASDKGMAILNAAPYSGGVLAKGVVDYPRYVYQTATEDALAPARRVEVICAKYDIPPGAVALQFSMRDPRVTATICGVSKPERVQQTYDWAQWPIPEQAWQELMNLPYDTDDPEATRIIEPSR